MKIGGTFLKNGLMKSEQLKAALEVLCEHQIALQFEEAEPGTTYCWIHRSHDTKQGVLLLHQPNCRAMLMWKRPFLSFRVSEAELLAAEILQLFVEHGWEHCSPSSEVKSTRSPLKQYFE